MPPKMRDAQLKPYQMPLSGRLRTSIPPGQLEEGDFRQLINMRYTRAPGIKAIKGMSKVSDELVSPAPPAMEMGYTSQQMGGDDEQELTVTGGEPTYTWTVESGGGTVVPTTGSSSTYTAPSENPGCVNNPIIRVTDRWGSYVEIEVAVNTWPGADGAYVGSTPLECQADVPTDAMCDGNECPEGWDCCYSCCHPLYDCDNQVTQVAHSSQLSTQACDESAWCAAHCVTYAGSGDTRSQEMIDGGCCPEILL